MVKKEPNQVNGTVATAARLGTTRVRAKKMQKKILYQIQVACTRNLFIVLSKVDVHL